MQKVFEMQSSDMKIQSIRYEGNTVQTHKVLVEAPEEGQSTYAIYCPCYLRIKIKNILSLSLDSLNSTLNTKIMFDLNLTDLPQKIKQQIKSSIVLRFHRDSVLKLGEENPEISVKTRRFGEQELIGYRIRKEISTGIIPDVFWTPFQVLYLMMSISIQHLEFQDEETIEEFSNFMKKRNLLSVYPKPSKLQVRFNLMNFIKKQWQYEENGLEHGDMARILFTDDSSFGNYDLAEKLLSVEYTSRGRAKRLRQLGDIRNKQGICNCCYKKFNNFFHEKKNIETLQREEEEMDKIKEKNNQYKNKKVHSFKYAHFEIPLYRRPIISLLTIFLPLWLLGLISLGIFFQSNELADRIASIATVMIAHIAFMPVIRGQLPPSPRIAFIEILVYLQILITFFCLIESVLVRQSDTVFVWWENGLFLLSLVIQIMEGVVVVLLTMVYCFCWLPGYNLKPGQEMQLDINQWYNFDCDIHFNEKIQLNNYKIYELENFKNN